MDGLIILTGFCSAGFLVLLGGLEKNRRAAAQRGQAHAAGAEEKRGEGGMKVNELLGLIDVNEEVQLMYPNGDRLTGPAGRLYDLVGENEVDSIGTDPFRVWVRE